MRTFNSLKTPPAIPFLNFSDQLLDSEHPIREHRKSLPHLFSIMAITLPDGKVYPSSGPPLKLFDL